MCLKLFSGRLPKYLIAASKGVLEVYYKSGAGGLIEFRIQLRGK